MKMMGLPEPVMIKVESLKVVMILRPSFNILNQQQCNY
jgi:hypothetical protein